MNSIAKSAASQSNSKSTIILIKSSEDSFKALVNVFSLDFPDLNKPLPSKSLLSLILSLVADKSGLDFKGLPDSSEHQVFFNEGSTLARLYNGEEIDFPEIVHIASFKKLYSDIKLVDEWLLDRAKLNNRLIAEKVLERSSDLEELYKLMYNLEYFIYQTRLLLDFWKKARLKIF